MVFKASSKDHLHERSGTGSPPSWHTHSVQSSVLTQAPQQSPPSKLHSALFASSLQSPLSTSEGLGQSVGVGNFFCTVYEVNYFPNFVLNWPILHTCSYH